MLLPFFLIVIGLVSTTFSVTRLLIVSSSVFAGARMMVFLYTVNGFWYGLYILDGFLGSAKLSGKLGSLELMLRFRLL